jgi:hypothetical protein
MLEPTICTDCDKPIFYDDERDMYRHLEQADRLIGCFLIYPENPDGTPADGQWVSTPPDLESSGEACPDCSVLVAPGEPYAPFCSLEHSEAGQ